MSLTHSAVFNVRRSLKVFYCLSILSFWTSSWRSCLFLAGPFGLAMRATLFRRFCSFGAVWCLAFISFFWISLLISLLQVRMWGNCSDSSVVFRMTFHLNCLLGPLLLPSWVYVFRSIIWHRRLSVLLAVMPIKWVAPKKSVKLLPGMEKTHVSISYSVWSTIPIIVTFIFALSLDWSLDISNQVMVTHLDLLCENKTQFCLILDKHERWYNMVVYQEYSTVAACISDWRILLRFRAIIPGVDCTAPEVSITGTSVVPLRPLFLFFPLFILPIYLNHSRINRHWSPYSSPFHSAS